MRRGLTYREAKELRRRQPMTSAEIIDFYTSGTLPTRFQEWDDVRSRRIVKDFTNGSESEFGGDLF